MQPARTKYLFGDPRFGCIEPARRKLVWFPHKVCSLDRVFGRDGQFDSDSPSSTRTGTSLLEMAAYAALVSCMYIIEQLEHHPRPPITLDKEQVESLTEKLTFLQEFLEGYSSGVGYSREADDLESRIADAACAAEDIIESHIVDRILTRPTSHGEEISSNGLYQDLQKVIEDMGLSRKR
ncbi:hypothetical protein ACS0TY_036162 [Phlomoides rotata]